MAKTASPALKKYSPLQAVLLLGGVTALTLYISMLITLFLFHFVLHWIDPLMVGTLLDLIPGSLLVALLNMFLWSLFVALPRRAHRGHAILSGIVCGLLAPSIVSIAATFSQIVRLGYFLNYAGAHSTNLVELMQWPLTNALIIVTFLMGWFTILLCILLNVLLLRRLDRSEQSEISIA